MQDGLIKAYRDSWDRRRLERRGIYDMLFEERIILLPGEINLDSATAVVSQLLILERENPDKEIQLYISSSGGGVYHGMAIYDTMQMVRAPVSTIAVGWTASMGTVLLAAGAPGRRFALPHATIHMHPAATGMQGYAPDVESERTVNVHICRLREKVELNPSRPTLILTVPGIGYRLVG